MLTTAIAVCWILSLAAATTFGFHWSKRVGHHDTMRDDLARRARVGRAYGQATLVALSPAYKRRHDRKVTQARQAQLDSRPTLRSRFTT